MNETENNALPYPIFQFYENGEGGDFVRAEDAAKLQKRISELESKLEPERQKIWVLVWRNPRGDLSAHAYTDPKDPCIELQSAYAGPGNCVLIHASI